MKLLVVEDEHQMRSYLHRRLTERGFLVDTAENGDAGLHLALTEDYAVVILDIMLPKRDGQSVIRGLRASGKPTPALFLTAHDFIPGKMKDLKLGAHDYLAKPFAFLGAPCTIGFDPAAWTFQAARDPADRRS